ncbi:MAG: replication initiator protein A [Clostridia bacterium]|nr:replication initiator protein A [Clostridia bacterium]
MSIVFDYYYGNEAEQFTFYRIPKLLMTSPEFKRVSDSAKLLYGLMLDRMSLSIKNGWLDEQQRAYIYFTTNDVMEQMCCGTEKATKLIAELDSEKGIGLIERKKQGQGKPTIIYLKNFIIHDTEHRNSRLSEIESQDFGKSKVKTFDNQNSRVSEIENADFRQSKCSDNNISDNEKKDNELSYTESIISYPINENGISSSAPAQSPDMIRWIEERNTYEHLIKRNIEYDIIVKEYTAEWLDEIVELMVDVVCSKEPYIRINKQDYPQEIVKSRFLKIDSSHIEYINFALKENTSNVRNIRAFLITTIYRSFETADNWYSAKVKHDMAHPKKNWSDS